MDKEEPCRGPPNLQSTVTTIASVGIQHYGGIDRPGHFIAFVTYRGETEAQGNLNDLVAVEDSTPEWREQIRVTESSGWAKRGSGWCRWQGVGGAGTGGCNTPFLLVTLEALAPPTCCFPTCSVQMYCHPISFFPFLKKLIEIYFLLFPNIWHWAYIWWTIHWSDTFLCCIMIAVVGYLALPSHYIMIIS